ncbi:MAG: GNAT family N-acetyltransferase [Spirochaetes bacterium]|nr:GNAT family N-acetyltransferase [Spirochaetota bacterium]
MEIEIRTGVECMDFPRVAALLATAYWSPGIKEAEVRKGALHSALVVGAFHSGEQVGYARAISDTVRFAYLADVFVDERFRGQGIGKMMVGHILRHETLREVYQWVLKTKDAHKVYEKLGFGALGGVDKWMEIWSPRPAR